MESITLSIFFAKGDKLPFIHTHKPKDEYYISHHRNIDIWAWQKYLMHMCVNRSMCAICRSKEPTDDITKVNFCAFLGVIAYRPPVFSEFDKLTFLSETESKYQGRIFAMALNHIKGIDTDYSIAPQAMWRLTGKPWIPGDWP